MRSRRRGHCVSLSLCTRTGATLLVNFASITATERAGSLTKFAASHAPLADTDEHMATKGAAGRVSTADGLLLTYVALCAARSQYCYANRTQSDDNVGLILKQVDAAKSAKAASKAKQAASKAAAAAFEHAARARLVELGFLSHGKSPTAKLLDEFHEANKLAHWPVPYTSSGSKGAKVQAVLAFVGVETRYVRHDGTAMPIVCTECAATSSSTRCASCACRAWYCEACEAALASHRGTCAFAASGSFGSSTSCVCITH